MVTPALSDRTRRILATLVRSYIETGEPVASAALAQKAGLNVSSATVRNVMAQLEEMGYVWQPHTSAGRVPTDTGYRCYVDMLIESRRPTKDVSAVELRLRQEAGDTPLIDDLLSSTSHVLSETSKSVGFAIGPPNARALFQRIEFVPLSGNRMVEEKQRLVGILTEYIDGPGLTVVIGAEHSDPELRPFSLIAATYFDGRNTGTVGVIGPTRMRYSKAISVVDIAALAVARVLRDVN